MDSETSPKGSIQLVKKGHPSLATQVDLILQNWWEFKVLVTIGLNRLSSFHRPLWYTNLFTVSYSLLDILSILVKVEREI